MPKPAVPFGKPRPKKQSSRSRRKQPSVIEELRDSAGIAIDRSLISQSLETKSFLRIAERHVPDTLIKEHLAWVKENEELPPPGFVVKLARSRPVQEVLWHKETADWAERWHEEFCRKQQIPFTHRIQVKRNIVKAIALATMSLQGLFNKEATTDA